MRTPTFWASDRVTFAAIVVYVVMRAARIVLTVGVCCLVAACAKHDPKPHGPGVGGKPRPSQDAGSDADDDAASAPAHPHTKPSGCVQPGELMVDNSNSMAEEQAAPRQLRHDRLRRLRWHDHVHVQRRQDLLPRPMLPAQDRLQHLDRPRLR